jgi:hypothetical protein
MVFSQSLLRISLAVARRFWARLPHSAQSTGSPILGLSEDAARTLVFSTSTDPPASWHPGNPASRKAHASDTDPEKNRYRDLAAF